MNIFNLGTDEYCQVNDSIGWIVGHLGIDPARTYTGGERGWIGDSPFIFLDTLEDPGPRVAAQGVDSRGHHQDARLPARQHLADGRAVMNVGVLETVAVQ